MGFIKGKVESAVTFCYLLLLLDSETEKAPFGLTFMLDQLVFKPFVLEGLRESLLLFGADSVAFAPFVVVGVQNSAGGEESWRCRTILVEPHGDVIEFGAVLIFKILVLLRFRQALAAKCIPSLGADNEPSQRTA